MSRIILKNSNGFDKEPTTADLVPGELAINTVTGAMYHKTNDGSGDVISSTNFKNIFNLTPVPVVSIPATANEGQVIDITVTNYDGTAQYTVNVTGGTVDTSSHPFKWTLPPVLSSSVTHGIQVQAQAPNKTESDPSNWQYITVSNVSGILDAAIILNSTNIASDGTDFDTLSNAEIILNSVKATADDIIAETVNFQQEAEDSDWNKYQTSIKVSHNDIIDHEFNKTLQKLPVTAEGGVQAGDILYVKQGDLIKNVQVGLVDDTELKYSFINIGAKSDGVSLITVENTQRYYGDATYGYSGISDIKEISFGNNFAMCVKTDGSLWAIGYNSNGQLGLGDTTIRGTWTDTGITGVKSVACGYGHTIILKTDGSIWSTGYNNYGQLGLGDTTDRTLFTDTGIQATQVACGYDHAIILKTDGSIWSTGRNSNGQLGLGDTTDRTLFTDTGIQATQVACGYGHTIILKTDGSIWSTGYNNYGQLGLGDTSQRTSFTDTGIQATQVACGYDYTIILKTDGSIWSTGYNNYGQLGLGDTSQRTSFTQIPNFVADDIYCNFQGKVSSAIYQNRAYLWGNNVGGTSVSDNILSPTLAADSQEVIHWAYDFTPSLYEGIDYEDIDIYTRTKSLSFGKNYSMRIDENGKLWARGDNGYGQLGLGDTTDRTDWTDTGITGVKSVACGYDHAIILKTDGSIWSTGQNTYGQLGLGDTTDRTLFTDTGIQATQVACGFYHTIILKTDGSVWSTGYNNYGQLGVNNETTQYSFVKVPGVQATQVACGFYYTIVLKTDGSVWSTGYNAYGQLGLGDTTGRTLFTDTGIQATQVACGFYHTIILKTDGSVWSTGYNNYGQLGLGDTSQRTSFTDTGTQATQVACGYSHTIILKTDGSVWSTGYNNYGQLGLGDTSQRTSFTDIGTAAAYIYTDFYSSSTGIQTSDNAYLICGSNSTNMLTNISGDQLSFIHPDGTDGTPGNEYPLLYTPIEDLIPTYPSYDQVPTWAYKKTLVTSTSLSSTTTKSFVQDTLASTPTEILNGLQYTYNAVTPASTGRYLSVKAEGLLDNEVISEIRVDLEKV